MELGRKIVILPPGLTLENETYICSKNCFSKSLYPKTLQTVRIAHHSVKFLFFSDCFFLSVFAFPVTLCSFTLNPSKNIFKSIIISYQNNNGTTLIQRRGFSSFRKRMEILRTIRKHYRLGS